MIGEDAGMIRRLIVMVLLAPLVFGVALSASGTETSAYCVGAADTDLLDRINAYRVTNGRAPLAMSQTLGAAAEHHALDLANFSTPPNHTLSDGTTWLQNIANHGYPMTGTVRGENIGWGFGGDNQRMLDWWKSSSGHNANLLDTRWTAIGITRAFVAGSTWGWYWVVTFGSVLDGAGVTCNDATATATPSPTMRSSPPHRRTATAIPAGRAD